MPGDDRGSVTRWIADLKGGDPAAVQPLWERYFTRMIELRGPDCMRVGAGTPAATRKMRRSAPSTASRGSGPGPIPPTGRPRRPLATPGGHHDAQGPAQARRQKRGGGHVHTASDLADRDSDDEDDLLARAVGTEPTPEFAAMVAEEYRQLLKRLGDDVLRKVAILRMEGFTTDAIAEQLGCARRTIARQLSKSKKVL